MFSAFERLVALRYLRARRQEGFISVIAGFSLLGIMLGVATLIIVMSVMNGFRDELLGRILGVNGHISVIGSQRPISDFDPLAADIRKLPGVVEATPLVQGQVLLSAGGYASGGMVRGVRADDFVNRPLLANSLIAGSMEDYAKGDGIIIGSRLAGRLRVVLGDDVTFISPHGNATAFGTIPRMKAYRVAAVFEVGMYEYDSNFVYMPLDNAQVFFQYRASVSHIEVMLDNPDLARRMQPVVKEVVGNRARVVEWQRVNASFFNALKIERDVMFLILTMIIIVAAFNIISSQIMLVQDKGKGIAILRTVGATRGMILRIFFATGASVGILGTAAGAALGIAFATNIETIRRWLEGLTGYTLWDDEIRFLSQIPAKIDSGETVIVIVMALLLTFLASLYPAWRAARLDPVEVLRYE